MVELDCQSCAACCRNSIRPPFSRAGEVEALPEPLRRAVIQLAEGHIGPCRWLAGTLCGEYELRPVACREFVIGSEACLRHRREHGF